LSSGSNEVVEGSFGIALSLKTFLTIDIVKILAKVVVGVDRSSEYGG